MAHGDFPYFQGAGQAVQTLGVMYLMIPWQHSFTYQAIQRLCEAFVFFCIDVLLIHVFNVIVMLAFYVSNFQ